MNSHSSFTRRTFLALGATGVAGLAAVGKASAASRFTSSGTIGVGVIGLGSRGMELLNDFASRQRAREGVRVAAVCDAHELRLQQGAALSGAEAVREWERVVERKDVDAVVIATPNHWHAAMAVAAMQAGKHVYLETPMAHTLAEAKLVRDTAASTGRCVQIGAQETSEGQWHAANALVRSGRLGAIQWCQASERMTGRVTPSAEAVATADASALDWKRWQGPAEQRPFDAQRFLHWRNYWDYSGGIAANEFFHMLAPMLVTIGPAFPERVSAAGGVYIDDGREAPDSFVMTAEYAQGHTVVLASSPAHAQGTPAVIRGTDAAVYFDKGKVSVVSEFGKTVGAKAAVTARPGHVDNWLAGIRSGERCVCDAELGYRTMAATGMAVEAYRSGKTLYWDAASESAVTRSARGVLV